MPILTSKKAEQTTIQQQVGVESGVGYGSVYSRKAGVTLGGGSQGNIILGEGVGQAVKGGQGGNLSIVTNDPSTALAALEANQALSTLAVSYANTTSLSALETLRALQGGAIVATAPSSNANAVQDALAGKPSNTVANTVAKETTNKTALVVIGIVIAFGITAYILKQ